MLIPQVHILNHTDYAVIQCALQTSQFKKLVKGFHNMELCAQRTHNTLSLNATTSRHKGSLAVLNEKDVKEMKNNLREQ